MTEKNTEPSGAARKKGIIFRLGVWVYEKFHFEITANVYFWTLFLVTMFVVLAFWLRHLSYYIAVALDLAPTSEYLAYSPDMLSVYFGMLGFYVAYNEFAKIKIGKHLRRKPGDFLVVMWGISAIYFYVANQINPNLLIPEGLMRITLEVWGAFAIGRSINLVFQKKEDGANSTEPE
jgi:hypothetical protein